MLLYIPQNHKSACSLAVLRMVLKAKDIDVSEEELIGKIEGDYGKHFKNIWNPTIAKLAREYGIETRMYALWPLFKRDKLKAALKEYQEDPRNFNVFKYENKKDKDRLPETLPLSYKEMFEAVNKGCKVTYGSLTPVKIKKLLSQGHLIQTSIHRERFFPDKPPAYHSILIYGYKDEEVFFHDPDNGPSRSRSLYQLMSAMQDVGAVIVYKINNFFDII